MITVVRGRLGSVIERLSSTTDTETSHYRPHALTGLRDGVIQGKGTLYP